MFTISGRHDFSIAEAQWLSDLTGIDADLEACERLCNRSLAEHERLKTLPSQGDETLKWVDDLWTMGDIDSAAIIRLGRTFATGVRRGIPAEWIAQLPPKLQAAHEHFKALRDKHIAHSVNVFEDNQVFVFLSADDLGALKPVQITVDRGRVFALGIEGTVALRLLAKILRQRVKTEIESESARLLEVAKSMPVDKLLSRGGESLDIPSGLKVKAGRRPFNSPQ